MSGPCDTCLRWPECNGVDAENCPICKAARERAEKSGGETTGRGPIISVDGKALCKCIAEFPQPRAAVLALRLPLT